MKTENTPSVTSIKAGETIELSTRFGGLSRGKCWGKFYAGKTRATGDFEWCEKSGGTLHLTGPGHYVVGSGDGFSRQAKAEFTLAATVPYAEKSTEEKITHQRRLIAVGEAKDPEGIVVMNGAVGNLAGGSSVLRSALIAERKRLIEELEAPVKTAEQQKAEESMLG